MILYNSRVILMTYLCFSLNLVQGSFNRNVFYLELEVKGAFQIDNVIQFFLYDHRSYFCSKVLVSKMTMKTRAFTAYGCINFNKCVSNKKVFFIFRRITINNLVDLIIEVTKLEYQLKSFPPSTAKQTKRSQERTLRLQNDGKYKLLPFLSIHVAKILIYKEGSSRLMSDKRYN